MNGRFRTILTLGLILTCMGGCDDPKQRIALLENENRSLSFELDKLRQQSQSAKRDLQDCQGRLAGLQDEANGLRNALSAQPELPGDWQPVAGGAMIAIEGNVLFPAGRTELRPESKGVLDRIASEIKGSFSGKDIYVFGHTDTDPIKKSGWKDNRELSAERALAVVRQLHSAGIEPQSIVACGWGEYRPVTANTSNDGKAKNRRVEIFAVDASLAMGPK